MVVFRILQESLANASRHAPGARVLVEIGYDAATVSVSVVNGPATSDVTRPAGGHDGVGITGMVTRAQAVGGDLTAQQTDDGGFAVSARIPKHVPEAPATPAPDADSAAAHMPSK